ncbi:hypothetical protein R80B4_01939 [Fibrobacteres bacterium R8-0-B4]
MNFFTRHGRTLLIAAVLAVGAAWLAGCGDDGEEADKSNVTGGTNCTSAGTCKSDVMPDGKTWMTENLNIKTANSWCYNDSGHYCAKYGRLYTWNAARTACPGGWHLPSREEWSALVLAAGDYAVAGNALKSSSGWKPASGRDDYGFSALPGGSRLPDGSYGAVVERWGYWWTATEFGRDSAYLRIMSGASSYVEDSYQNKNYGRSVRLYRRQLTSPRSPAVLHGGRRFTPPTVLCHRSCVARCCSSRPPSPRPWSWCWSVVG